MKSQILLLSALLLSSNIVAAETEAQQRITRAGTQAPMTGLDDYFTGQVTVIPVFPSSDTGTHSGAYVTFEAGARTNWHLHPAGQHMIVTEGEGWTQSWDGEVSVVKAGDVVWCPPEVKHWHGASATTSMTHLVITNVKDGKNVEWLEPVTDEQYHAPSQAAQ